jgi:hypothetical protein
VLIAKRFLDASIVRCAQKRFRDVDQMQQYFSSIFAYLDSPVDCHAAVDPIIQLRRNDARSRPVSVLVHDLAIFWNAIGDLALAQLVPGAVVEVPEPANYDWAVWHAAQTLTTVSLHAPGSVILVTLTNLLPRSRKFAKVFLKMFRTEGDLLIKHLDPSQGQAKRD